MIFPPPYYWGLPVHSLIYNSAAWFFSFQDTQGRGRHRDTERNREKERDKDYSNVSDDFDGMPI